MNYDIGLIGIAVMGENLALNMASKGFSVVVNSRKQDTIDTFLNSRAKGLPIFGTTDLQTLVSMLKVPRKVLLMIKAGDPVDQVIEQLIPLLSPGDVILDGGNSNYEDTTRRTNYLKTKALHFIGTGVSGGEEGALIGPSIMPGGDILAWPIVKPILQAIAAKVDDGSVCCDWVGSDGAGHFVKMVHNGIEYGDIQLITEIYFIMKHYLKMTNKEMSDTFQTWNEGILDSYLIEITADILSYKENGVYVLDSILDTAGQKGTGKWTVNSALEHGTPLSLIAESVFARFLSAQKDSRVIASSFYPKTISTFEGDRAHFLEDLKHALYAAKIISYTQGYVLMQEAGKTYNWNLNLGGIALMWRGGCIIRSAFLDKIKHAFTVNPTLENLLLDPYFKHTMTTSIQSLRRIVSTSALNALPVPTLSSGLSYFDGYTTHTLPANLLQAMRDYFGAHTYERTDEARGKFFHTNWTGRGGKTASTTYNV